MPPALSSEDLVRAAFLAHNRDDVDGFLRHLAPDVEWESVGLLLHPAGVWRGHDAVRSALQRWRDEHGGPAHVTLRELAAHGDEVLALGIVSARSARRSFTSPASWIFHASGGVATRVQALRSDSAARAIWDRRLAQAS